MKKITLILTIISFSMGMYAAIPPMDTTITPKKDTFKMTSSITTKEWKDSMRTDIKEWKDSTKTNINNWNDTAQAAWKSDTYHFKNGKLVQKINGTTTNVTKDIALKNGAAVSPSGIVKLKDGNLIQLKNGDTIDSNGNITKSNKTDNNKQVSPN